MPMSVVPPTVRAPKGPCATVRRASIAAFVAAGALVIGAASPSAQAASAHPAEVSREQQGAAVVATLAVPEILFAGCSPAVHKALNDAGGVARIAEGGPHRIFVTYEPAPGRPGVYVDVLHKAGFPGAHLIPAG